MEPWIEINPALLTSVVAALVGMLSGWVAAYLKVKGENLATKEDFAEALRQAIETTQAVERARSDVALRSTLNADLREAVKEATAAIGGLVHAICWLTWDSVNRRRVDSRMVERYDDEAHKLTPAIMGQLAVIAMLRSNIHARLAPLAEEAFELDARVGDAVIKGERDLNEGLGDLIACHDRSLTLAHRIRSVVADLFATDDSR